MVNDKIFFITRDELLRLYVRNVLCFVADGNYTKITLVSGSKYTVASNLSTIEKILNFQKLLSSQDSNKLRMFIRVGKSHIINVDFIQHINIPLKRIILSDGASTSFQLHTSKDALKTLKTLIIESNKL